VPAVAATPKAAAEPALPNAPLEPGVAARAEPIEPPKPGAKPRHVNLWPLFQYDSDPTTQSSHLKIFGPLIEYRSDAARQAFFVRPLVWIDQSRVGHDDHVSLFGPFLRSHWGQTEQQTTGLGGLLTYRTRTSEDGRTLESQRVLLPPVYAYQWDRPDISGRVSVAPFYVDVTDTFGYDHVEMVMFPAYVHVQRPQLDRYYYPYPIITRDGPEGSGYRLWPFPLRDREGNLVERDAAASDAAADAGCAETYFPVMRDELDVTASKTVDPS
jgi:hypothetical protein